MLGLTLRYFMTISLGAMVILYAGFATGADPERVLTVGEIIPEGRTHNVAACISEDTVDNLLMILSEDVDAFSEAHFSARRHGLCGGITGTIKVTKRFDGQTVVTYQGTTLTFTKIEIQRHIGDDQWQTFYTFTRFKVEG